MHKLTLNVTRLINSSTLNYKIFKLVQDIPFIIPCIESWRYTKSHVDVHTCFIGAQQKCIGLVLNTGWIDKKTFQINW